MTLRSACLAALALSVWLTGCSDGGGGGNALVSALQDLDQDPNGLTTLLTFAGEAPLIGPGSVEASAGQTATSVSLDGSNSQRLVVVWDERVTPSHTVTIVGQEDIPELPRQVTTSDSSVPSFSIESASQGAGLGNDSLELQFSGPRVVPEQVEDGALWTLTAGIYDQSLAGSQFSFDVESQLLTITTGVDANLHGAFTLRVSGLSSVADTPVSGSAIGGTASGDSTAPTVTSLVQNLSADAFGRVIDLTFSEAIDPLFSNGLVNYSLGFPEFASQVEQTSASTFRLRFDDPVIPGNETLSLAGILDAHGNAYTGPGIAVAAGATFANSYAINPELRSVAGQGNDQLRITTTQAFDPSAAEDSDNWSLSVGGNAVSLANASFDYDLLTSTLIATLPTDFTNGSAFQLTPNGVLEVDGQSFSTAFSGTVAGDSLVPGIAFILQNRTLDFTGRTLDVHLTEAVDETSAETLGNFTPFGGPNVTAAVLQPSYNLVRLSFDAPFVPGVATLSVAGLADLAGNTMVPANTIQAITTDTVQPEISAVVATGVEGPDNDSLAVTFTDDMYLGDVLSNWRWNVESPKDTALNTGLASVSWDAASRTATLTFDGGDGIAFVQGEDVWVDFDGVRDVGGNLYGSGWQSQVTAVEENLPILEARFVRQAPNNNQVVLRYSEAIGAYNDGPTEYRLLDPNGTFVANPSTVTLSGDGRGIVLSFGLVVVPGFHTLTARGMTDLAQNPAFPALNADLDAETGQSAGFAGNGSQLLAAEGEANDNIVIEFNEAISTLGATTLSNYSLHNTTLDVPVDLSGARVLRGGGTTALIEMHGDANLTVGHSYELSFINLVTAQGLDGGGTQTLSLVAVGDSSPPAPVAGRATLDGSTANALLVDLDEACQLEGSAGQFLLDGVPAIDLLPLGPKTARVLFAGQPTVGQVLSVTATDLAGNVGTQSLAVTGADVNGPLVFGAVLAVGIEGPGGDVLDFGFSEPLDIQTALNPGLFGVTLGGQPLDLTQAVVEYSSVGDRLLVNLPAGVELDLSQTIVASVSGLVDWAGNAMPTPASVQATNTGDNTSPELLSAFVDWRVDSTGRTIAVLFSEAQDPNVALDPANYSSGGAQAVLGVSALGERAVRLTLTSPWVDGQLLGVSVVRDLAGNTDGNLFIDVLE
jgi:hypothetical protein